MAVCKSADKRAGAGCATKNSPPMPAGMTARRDLSECPGCRFSFNPAGRSGRFGNSRSAGDARPWRLSGKICRRPGPESSIGIDKICAKSRTLSVFRPKIGLQCHRLNPADPWAIDNGFDPTCQTIRLWTRVGWPERRAGNHVSFCDNGVANQARIAAAFGEPPGPATHPK